MAQSYSELQHKDDVTALGENGGHVEMAVSLISTRSLEIISNRCGGNAGSPRWPPSPDFHAISVGIEVGVAGGHGERPVCTLGEEAICGGGVAAHFDFGPLLDLTKHRPLELASTPRPQNATCWQKL
jgi:hypothetical protein